MREFKAHICCSVAVLGTFTLGGCVERRIWIDTEPAGALVWLNDAQLGRTPLDLSITHDGVYDLRIEKEGYEPIVTSATVDGPLWDQPPLDLFAEVLPVHASSTTRWRFTLRLRNDSLPALADRAERMREQLLSERPLSAEAGVPAPQPSESTTP